MIRYIIRISMFIAVVFGFAGVAQAAGTISGSFQGPEGLVDASIRFFKGATEVTTTTSGGSFSQSLEAGEWSMVANVNAHPEYGEFAPFDIPRLHIDDGDTINLGTLPVHFDVDSADTDDLEDFPAQPAICFDNGGPIIIRSYFSDLKKGNFIYANRSNEVTLLADQEGYTVTADYSIYEGNQPGADTVTLTDNGDGSYTGSFTVSNTGEGGGMAIFTVQDGEGNISRSCTQGGPLNLDIRQFLDGADTTNFAAVDDFRAIENFTMHVNGVVKITMKRPVNMLDPNVQRFFKSLASTFEHETGRMELNAKAAKMLQKAGAQVTFYNVPDQYIGDPEILLDGAAAGDSVADIVYDKATKTLTFEAAHFSEYKLAPKVTITSPETNSSTGDTEITVTGTVSDLTASLQFHVNGVDNGTTVPSSDGTWSKQVTLNTSGDNTVSVVGCNTSACSSSQSITVSHGATTTTVSTSSSDSSSTSSSSSSSSDSSTLPKTGSSPWASVGFLVMAVLGIGLAVGARRMRAQKNR